MANSSVTRKSGFFFFLTKNPYSDQLFTLMEYKTKTVSL